MVIKSIKRPWQKSPSQGARHDPDPYYQSSEWKSLRKVFLNQLPKRDLPAIKGIPYQNKYCIECWKKGIIDNTYAIDHIQRRRDGGKDDINNLQGLCKRHHASKSAEEANETKRKL